MSEDACGPNLPAWLIRARKDAARRRAGMTPEQRIADIHKGAQAAWKLLEQGTHARTRPPARRKARPSAG